MAFCFSPGVDSFKHLPQVSLGNEEVFGGVRNGGRSLDSAAGKTVDDPVRTG